MDLDIYDYRNGKYQGVLLDNRRQGPGVFIDDDLTLYASHWLNNQLHGQTLLYISHGKYIYGQWSHNQLSGLAVFRCADTILIGNFQENYPVGRCLIIFERFNFACILEEGQEWLIVESGSIPSHKVLLEFVKKIGTYVPEHYYSLTKFVGNFDIRDNIGLKSWKCRSGHTYFGFADGLAMIFNLNNGLISMGKHTGEKVSQFGGKFDGARGASEGNFEPKGKNVSYSGERPSRQIYSIFHKLHKKSINFVNEYFDSKVKIFTDVQALLRSQLDNFMKEYKKNYSFGIDLNDSLDYQDYNQEESCKLNSIRDNLYGQDRATPDPSSASTPKSTGGNTTASKKRQESEGESRDKNMHFFRKNQGKSRASEGVSKKQTENFSSPVDQLKQIQQNPAVYPVRRSPFKTKRQPFLQAQKSPLKSRASNVSAKKESIPVASNTFESKEVTLRQQKSSRSKAKLDNRCYIPEKIVISDNILNEINIPKTNNIYKDTARVHEEDSLECYQLPTFNCAKETKERTAKKEQKIKKEHTYQATGVSDPKSRSVSKSRKRGEVYQVAKPSYEDIEQRKRRVLKEYREINDKSTKASHQVQTQQYESPFQNHLFSMPQEEHQTGTREMMPLSIHNREKKVSPFKGVERQAQKMLLDVRQKVKHSVYLQEMNLSQKQNQVASQFIPKRADRKAKEIENYLHESPLKQSYRNPPSSPPSYEQQRSRKTYKYVFD